MTKVIERTSNKTADNEEIRKLMRENPNWITIDSVGKGSAEKGSELFIRINTIKYVNVPPRYWLIINSLMDDNGKLIIKNIKAISEEKFNAAYEIIENESGSFSEDGNKV